MVNKAHKVLTETTSQSKTPGTPGGDGISGSTAFDWHDGDQVPQYSKHLRGFEGISHTGQYADKQIHGTKSGSKAGYASSQTASKNGSFDRSAYQDIVKKSMVGGKLA